MAKPSKRTLIALVVFFVVTGIIGIGYWLSSKKPVPVSPRESKKTGPAFLLPVYEAFADSVLRTLNTKQKIA